MCTKRYYHYMIIISLSCAITGTISNPFSSAPVFLGITNITDDMPDEQRLFYTLMTGYEKAVRPTKKATDAVIVKLGVTLTLIMDLVSSETIFRREQMFMPTYIQDERNQILTTNIWLDQVLKTDVKTKISIFLSYLAKEWTDVFFRWNPADFGGIKKIRIPCRYIWLPDIVLYNSADDYTQGYMQSLAMVMFDGTVFWPPIVKLRSTCKIDITW